MAIAHSTLAPGSQALPPLLAHLECHVLTGQLEQVLGLLMLAVLLMAVRLIHHFINNEI